MTSLFRMLPGMAREIDDRALMVRYRNGEVAAFEVLYTRHKGSLYRYFLRQGFGPEPSAELTQEVWMKVIRAKERYEPSAKFTTYLYRLAHNCLVDQYRRSAHKIAQHSANDDNSVNELPAAAAGNPEAHAMRDEAVKQLRIALAKLPDEQREAFILKQETELSLVDVAVITGVSTETAKSRLRYAFSKLRRQLDEDQS